MEPDTGDVATDLPASAKGKAGKRFKATVPVYFHVVTDGAIGNVTDAQIADQIAVLNSTFAGGEGGAKHRLLVHARRRTRTDNADWFYAGPGGNDEHAMKRALHQGGDNALNFYSTTAGDYLGWAYLPDIVTKPGQAYLDGVVIDWESIPGTSTTYAGRYDQGETATHEVGHWLNLEHTFFGGCNAQGRLRRRHAGRATPTVGLPGGQGHLPGARARPDPQLHGLLLRHLLHGVHRRARRSGCGTPGCSTARSSQGGEGRLGAAVRFRGALSRLSGTRCDSTPVGLPD